MVEEEALVLLPERMVVDKVEAARGRGARV